MAPLLYILPVFGKYLVGFQYLYTSLFQVPCILTTTWHLYGTALVINGSAFTLRKWDILNLHKVTDDIEL